MQQRQSGQRAFSALVDWYDPLGSCVEITRPLSRSERGTSFTLLHLVVSEMRGGYGVKQQQNAYEEKCKFVFSL